MAYHILPGFLVRPAKRPIQDHWLGGPAFHEGARCPTCRKPFLLLWDINARDQRFVANDRPVFQQLKRLPLYYCWTCTADMSYRIVDDKRLELLNYSGTLQGKDFPYRVYPKFFERRPIELDPLKDAPKNVRRFLGSDYSVTLPKREIKPLERWLGHSVKFGFDIWWSQFGGQPWLVQGKERVACCNPNCSWARRGWAMKILASIINDPEGGMPMLETIETVKKVGGNFNTTVQVIFHICRGCLAVRAFNRCD